MSASDELPIVFRACVEEATLRKLVLMKQGLMQDLLTGRVRVPMKATGKAGKP